MGVGSAEDLKEWEKGREKILKSKKLRGKVKEKRDRRQNLLIVG